MVGDLGLDFEPHHPAETPPGQLRLDGREKVVSLVLLDLEVGVAGDPERMMIDDLHAREQRLEVGGDHLLERNEPLAVRHHNESGQDRRDFDPGEARHPGSWVAHENRQVEREI